MQKEIINGLSFLYFDHFKTHKELYHAVTTRMGGQSLPPYDSLNLGINTEDQSKNIIANLNRVGKSIKFDIAGLVSSTQIHSNKILIIKQKEVLNKATELGCSYHGFDAIITDQTETTLLIRVADCVPILLYDPLSRVIAVVHAGRDGTLSEITLKTIKKMQHDFGCSPKNIKAGIGPSIGKCCYSVSNKIANQFSQRLEKSEFFVEQVNNMSNIDLKEANRIQLIISGINKDRIETSDICTSCSSNIFFSHRREKGRTGRFALLAGLKPTG